MREDDSVLKPKGYPRIEFTKSHLNVEGRWFDVGAGGDDLRTILSKQFKREPETSEVDLEYQAYPFESDSFDTITSFEVLEHLFNPLFHLKEVQRILKPSGTLYLSTPDGRSMRSILSYIVDKRYADHIVEWPEEMLRRMFTRAGLDIIELTRYRTTVSGTITKFTNDGFWIRAKKKV